MLDHSGAGFVFDQLALDPAPLDLLRLMKSLPPALLMSGSSLFQEEEQS
jgi:hypothetical protein